MPRLSTHVLDIARGTAAAGLAIELHRLVDGSRQLLASTTTNTDGRTAAPLMTGEYIVPGVYELTFHTGDYFRSVGVELSDPPFLDQVVIRIGLADRTADYHVPLLLSPYGYSTYRGT